MRIVDGMYEETRDDSATVARAITAGGGPLFPPADWYKDPEFDRPTPITITADGQIKGHIASWTTDHVGLPPGTKPPRSRSDYAFFKTGVVKTDDGTDVHVGQLTLAGGHAPITADAAKAVEHYDNTESAVADITVGEDAHGIWVSGGIRPGVSDEKIRALRASAPSGDWRPIDGALELVAVCQVNTPGFPLARAMVASGEIVALVAAGASAMYELQMEQTIFAALDTTNRRVAELEGVVAALQSGTTAASAPADESTEDLDAMWETLTAAAKRPKPEPAAEEMDEDEDDEDDDPSDRRAALRAQFKRRRK